MMYIGYEAYMGFFLVAKPAGYRQSVGIITCFSYVGKYGKYTVGRQQRNKERERKR